MIDFVDAVRSESARFHHIVSRTTPNTDVPSCPGWTVADLTWHLTRVQWRFAAVVEDLLQDSTRIPSVARPPDRDLPELFQRTSGRLAAALERRSPEDRCWTLRRGDGTVGWVRRRQAHETLIHRVDGELAAGGDFAVDSALGADGVDEVLRTYLDLGSLPPWAAYEPDGTTALIALEDGSDSWALDLGWLTGTDPATGTLRADPSLRLVDGASRPSVVIRGSGSDLDLWLWGRGPLGRLVVEGDEDVALRIRATAALLT